MLKPSEFLHKVTRRFARENRRLLADSRIARMTADISAHFPSASPVRPFVFFMASTGLADFTYNQAYHLLTAWGLRLQGVPVVHFVCQRGMSPCIMGTVRQKPATPPPCADCIAHAKTMYRGAQVRGFAFQADAELVARLADLTVPDMVNLSFDHNQQGIASPAPLGALVTPGLRWNLRKHTLPDDEPTRFIFRQYILSAWNVAREFNALVERETPQGLVLFNGQFFPEAAAAWIARQHGLRVITHEVGFQPFSAFFTAGEATAYPLDIPADFTLDAAQDARLDAYLEKRFQGQFSMAGIRFWPHMKGLDAAFLERITRFKQIVPVFTNVIFDTSQPHANAVFSDMFAWLETVLDLARTHTDTLFVIRAHPDETRPGKESQETVADWIAARRATDLPNLVFVASTDYLSSYELIQRAKFTMIYNSTIGLEAAILGLPVLCAGKARFVDRDIVHFPRSVETFRRQAEEFLVSSEIKVPASWQSNARRFLYFQLFRTSLPFDPYLTASDQPGLVRFKEFTWQHLLPQNSLAMSAILDGLLRDGDFLLRE